MKFINPKQPIATCKSKSCDDCSVSKTLQCHAYPRDLPTLLLMVLPAIILGGAGIYNMTGRMFIPWLVVLIGYLCLVELRVIGTHSTQDADNEDALVYRTPIRALKMWICRSGSKTIQKRAIFLSGSALVWGYPIYFLVHGHQVFLLFAYLISMASFFVTLRRSFCSRCIHFSCPLNAVDDYLRSDFYEYNPSVAKLWHRKRGTPKILMATHRKGVPSV